MARGSTRRRRRIRACLPGALIAVAVLLPGSGGALVTVFPSFSPWFAVGTDIAPAGLEIAELNGDSKPDIVTANRLGDDVSVFLNAGYGSFLRRDYVTSARPSSLAVADLDGDGALEAWHFYPLGADPASVAIGDLNADGSADLATANTYAGTISVLLNDGNGRFPVRRDYATGDWAPSVAIGDLNDDGKADLVAGQFDRFVSVFFNRGDGTFGVPREHQTGRYSNDVAIADVNGDGAPDLATANYQSNTVSVLANWGDGSFVARRDYGTAIDPWSVAIGDLNGDGKPEVAAASEDADEISVLANTTGLCKVPGVHKKTLAAAKRAITKGLCRFGGLRLVYSSAIPKGRVLSAAPKTGTVLPTGSAVRLLVSRGRRR